MPEKRANIVVYKKKSILLQHKKILFLLVIILIALPVTVILVLNRQNFLNYADSGAIIQNIEVSPGKISIDVKSTEPVYLSALAYDSFGKPVKYLAVNYEWSMSSIDSIGTITTTYGEITEFRPLKYGCGELTVTARWGQEVLTKAIQVSISDGEDKPNCTGIPTLTPTPTLEPDPTTLNLESIKLHGLGKGGDNTNANLSGNLKPLRTVREISLELENSEGTALPILAGEISYSSSSGYFSGSVVLSNEIPSGSYILKVKSPQFLKRQVAGIVVVTGNKTSNISGLSLVAGDVDDDNSVDIDDYNLLIDCYSDILPARNCDDEAKKTAADLSDDGYVNSDDYNLFLRELSVLSGD